MMKEAIKKRLLQCYPKNRCVITELDKDRAIATSAVQQTDLRAGGRVSGPTIMEFMDVIAYVVILPNLEDAQDAVTVTLNVDFLSPAPFTDLYGVAKIIKKGRRLYTIAVEVYSVENKNEPVAISRIIYAVIANPLLK